MSVNSGDDEFVVVVVVAMASHDAEVNIVMMSLVVAASGMVVEQ